MPFYIFSVPNFAEQLTSEEMKQGLSGTTQTTTIWNIIFSTKFCETCEQNIEPVQILSMIWLKLYQLSIL